MYLGLILNHSHCKVSLDNAIFFTLFSFTQLCNRSGKVSQEPQVTHIFCSIIKQLRVLLFPPGGYASSSQGYPPQQYVVGYCSLIPGWRESIWSKVSCLRKQHHGRDKATNRQPSDLKSKSNAQTPGGEGATQ